MTWQFTGSRSDLVMELADAGHIKFNGWPKSQQLKPTIFDSANLIQRIENTKCTWTACQQADSKDLFASDMLSERKPLLTDRVNQSPNQRHGSVRYYSSPTPTVGITLVIPEEDYISILKLFEIVMHSDSVSYHLSLDFIGFSSTLNPSGNPTEAEFISGEPIAIGGFLLSISSPTKHA
jgi:hypothetical protein